MDAKSFACQNFRIAPMKYRIMPPFEKGDIPKFPDLLSEKLPYIKQAAHCTFAIGC
jgi:hypothetical protein